MIGTLYSRAKGKATSNHFGPLFRASIRYSLKSLISSLAAPGRNFDALMVKSLWSVMVLGCWGMKIVFRMEDGKLWTIERSCERFRLYNYWPEYSVRVSYYLACCLRREVLLPFVVPLVYASTVLIRCERQ